jgi:hypothetical protein
MRFTAGNYSPGVVVASPRARTPAVASARPDRGHHARRCARARRRARARRHDLAPVERAVERRPDVRGPSGVGAASEAPTGTLDPPRSPRSASDTIDARLDPSTRTLTGSARIVWRNITANPTSELRFHLYWNAWRDRRSTSLRERALDRTIRQRDDDLARFDVQALSYRPDRDQTAPVDLLPPARFIAPDNGNADDRTVMAIGLPEPVQPGSSVIVHVRWTARVPRPFARTGVLDDFYFIAQWFPMLGVLEDGGARSGRTCRVRSASG